MKAILIFLFVLAICAGLFFFAPHHRRTDDPFKPSTLAELYRVFFEDSPEITRPGIMLFLMLGVVGLATAFYPAIFVALARWAFPAAGQPAGALFVFGGLLAVVGALANFIAILVSHMTIGFGGGGDSTRYLTPFFWIIPLFQLIFAVASLAVGCSATVSSWMESFLACTEGWSEEGRARRFDVAGAFATAVAGNHGYKQLHPVTISATNSPENPSKTYCAAGTHCAEHN